MNNATINASGNSGGGEVLIGGNEHGAGPEFNATTTSVDANTKINASAINNGNGGKVIVWSNDNTNFHGNILAQGGALGGDGGFVETSGHNTLDVADANVILLAPNGAKGTWLLDPSNIYIALNQTNATAAGMSGTNTSANTGTGGNPNTFAASGAVQDSLLTTGALTTALATANVIVTTANASGTGTGNITVVDPITWSTTNSLTLHATTAINLNATTGTSISNAAGGSLTLNSDSGAINLNSASNAAISLSGGSSILTITNATNVNQNTSTATVTAAQLTGTVTGSINLLDASNHITALGNITAPSGFDISNGNNSISTVGGTTICNHGGY